MGDVTPIYYVISKDAKENLLMVGEANEATNDFFGVSEINEINPKGKVRIDNAKDLCVRIRHGGELIGARVGESLEGLNVELVKPVRGIASGQSVVFYSGGGECLGGGVIV
jgi:tRNA U34 2-thiouridine synthase MnmA/TrmU